MSMLDATAAGRTAPQQVAAKAFGFGVNMSF
jgi:hypothetical protein